MVLSIDGDRDGAIHVVARQAAEVLGLGLGRDRGDIHLWINKTWKTLRESGGVIAIGDLEVLA